jgi:hypothetical protein
MIEQYSIFCPKPAMPALPGRAGRRTQEKEGRIKLSKIKKQEGVPAFLFLI